MKPLNLIASAFSLVIIPYLYFYILICFETINVFSTVLFLSILILGILMFFLQRKYERHAVKLFYAWFPILVILWVVIEGYYYRHFVYGRAPLSFAGFFFSQWQDSILLFLPYVCFLLLLIFVKKRKVT